MQAASPADDLKRLSANQCIALSRFAEAHGDEWKNELRKAWSSGRYSFADDQRSLDQVRDEFGARWLANYEIRRTAGAAE